MLVLGIETSCDETGVALYDGGKGLLAHALHSQSAMHNEYGGVVPELASRDHIRRVLPLVSQVLEQAGATLSEVDLIAYTKGPGLAGALLVGASFAQALAFALQKPAIGIHHLEGHLLSPLLSKPAPEFPFVALLVSGGHTQLMRVERVGGYALLGETLDDAAGEAFDKCAKLLDLPYPGGPALSRLAAHGERTRFKLPRPMLSADSLDFSFSGLKTAVLTLTRQTLLNEQARCDLAAAVEEAIADVLTAKSLAALKQTGLNRLVVAGGVGANAQLRRRLGSQCRDAGIELFFPAPELCTDNGAMIALAGALRYAAGFLCKEPAEFAVRPRWNLEESGLCTQAVGP